jgi:hypothetical protein
MGSVSAASWGIRLGCISSGCAGAVQSSFFKRLNVCQQGRKGEKPGYEVEK